MRYALVSPANAVDRFANDIDPTVATKAGWRWLPCPVVDRPTINGATQITEGPVFVLGAAEVVETYVVRTLTAAELDARKEARLSAEDKLQFDVHFDMENRVRVLEGRPPVTRLQYRNALKALL